MHEETVRLLDYLVRVCPQWHRLSRLEKSFTLQSILPRIDIATACTKQLHDPDMKTVIIPILRDVHVSLEDHHTCIRTRTLGRISMLRYAKARLGYAPDVELPLVVSKDGMLHVLESLIVV